MHDPATAMPMAVIREPAMCRRGEVRTEVRTASAACCPHGAGWAWLRSPASLVKLRFKNTSEPAQPGTMNEERQQSHRVAFLGTHNWRGEAGPLPQSLDRRHGVLQQAQAPRGGCGHKRSVGASSRSRCLSLRCWQSGGASGSGRRAIAPPPASARCAVARHPGSRHPCAHAPFLHFSPHGGALVGRSPRRGRARGQRGGGAAPAHRRVWNRSPRDAGRCSQAPGAPAVAGAQARLRPAHGGSQGSGGSGVQRPGPQRRAGGQAPRGLRQPPTDAGRWRLKRALPASMARLRLSLSRWPGFPSNWSHHNFTPGSVVREPTHWSIVAHPP